MLHDHGVTVVRLNDLDEMNHWITAGKLQAVEQVTWSDHPPERVELIRFENIDKAKLKSEK